MSDNDPKIGFTALTPILCVTDASKSLEHYRSVLGFEVAWQWSEEDAFEGGRPTFACVRRGDVSIFLCEQGQGQPGAWISLHVGAPADVDAMHREYVRAGARVVEAPTDCSWGMREMRVEDLDGNTFRVGAPSSKG